MELFNKSMSPLRASVEWLFNDIVNYFKFIDFKKNLKIGLSAVGKMYLVCAVLRNALTFFYGNTTSEFYNLGLLPLPSLKGNIFFEHIVISMFDTKYPAI